MPNNRTSVSGPDISLELFYFLFRRIQIAQDVKDDRIKTEANLVEYFIRHIRDNEMCFFLIHRLIVLHIPFHGSFLMGYVCLLAMIIGTIFLKH